MSDINLNEIKNDDSKAWGLLEKVLMESVKEQKSARRWKNFFKILGFAYVFFIIFMIFFPQNKRNNKLDTTGEHTALINVKGVIAADEEASADKLITALQNAYEDENTKAIVLRINSPGGSPVQSGYVYDEILRMRKEKPQIKVYAVITDLGASGAYYIAAAADEIYADKSSLVGSIGVTAASFGFVETMNKLGVERRLYTSGEHKAFLDTFSPEKEDEKEFWKSVLETTHNQFINAVKNGRGERLKVDENPDLFSGLIWSGEQALELGLIDKLGNASYISREITKAKIVDFTFKDDPINNFMKKLGLSVSSGIKHSIQSFNEMQLR